MQYAKFHAKMKKILIGIFIYGYYRAGIFLYLDIIGLEFEKATVIFEINALEFV